MFLSKKEYQDLWEMIEKQNQQIEDLIKIAVDSMNNYRTVANLYFDLVEKVKELFPEIPSELEPLLNDCRENLKRGEGN